MLKNGDSDKEEDTVDLTASTLIELEMEIARQRQREEKLASSGHKKQDDDSTYACDKGHC